MASNRPSGRAPSRNGSPYVAESKEEQQTHPEYSEEWREPPLRTPAPSFHDYPGVSRGGVLENMLPLGTHPTARVKARSKGDSLRKTIQARNLGTGGLVVDDGRSTPEAATEQQTRAGTVRSDAANARRLHRSFEPTIDPALMDFEALEAAYRSSPGDSASPSIPEMMQLHESRQEENLEQQMAMDYGDPISQRLKSPLSQQPSMQISEPPLQVPSAAMHTSAGPPSSASARLLPPPLPAGATTVPAIPTNSPFFAAVGIANVNETPEVHGPLAFLYAHTQRDADLTRLLNEAAQSTANDDPVSASGSELAHKIKHLKKEYRSQHSTPSTRAASSASLISRQASSVVSPTRQTPANPLHNTLPFNSSHASVSRSPMRSTAASGAPATSPIGNMEGVREADEVPNMVEGGSSSSSRVRRGSSSPLSSVNEVLADGPSPLVTATQQQKSLKRSHAQAESLLDLQDAEMNKKRQRLKQDFSDLAVQDSNVRRALPVQTAGRTAGASSRPTPRLKFWPPGVQTEVVEVNGDGPTTPTALGRPPSSKKNVGTPRTKIS